MPTLIIGKMTELMDEKPTQWGFSGDEKLWDEMKDFFSNEAPPASASMLSIMLSEAYEKLTETSIRTGPDEVHIERYSDSQTEDNLVSRLFWKEVAVPLLMQRYFLSMR